MNRPASPKALWFVATVAIGFLVKPGSALAQAWVPPKGEGTVSVIYQNLFVRDHLFSDGERTDIGHIHSHGVLWDLTYGVSDKLAIAASLPYVAARYRGDRPHPGSRLDDGFTHGTLQDFRFDVRYNLMKATATVTPFVGVIVPTHSYPYYGHAAPGRRLVEVQFGVYAGRLLDTVLPGVFVQGRYSYGVPQRPLALRHDRSNVDLEIGYFINPRVRVFALSANQFTHGGIDFTHEFPRDLTPAEFLHHDQIARATLVEIGGGVQLTLTQSVDVFGSMTTTLYGTSGHALNRGIAVGIAWSFGKRRDDEIPLVSEQVARALPRCLCQKGQGGS